MSRIKDVEGDAAAYPIPRDVNVIYMANAFLAGATLRKVVSNIRESYLLAPRPMYITYFVTQYAWDSVVTEFPWIQRRATHTYYPGWPYGLYEVCPRPPYRGLPPLQIVCAFKALFSANETSDATPPTTQFDWLSSDSL